MKLNVFQWKQKEALQHPPKNPLPSLVFLHGLGGTGQIWRPITANLETEFDCYAPDQRGHGQSRPVPESEQNRFHSLDFAKDVSDWTESAHLKRFIVIGHSMGVRTALALSTLIPEKIIGIIAVDLGISSQWGGGMGIALSQFIQKLPESFPTREELKQYLTTNCPDPSIAQYLAAVAKQKETWTFPFDHQALVKTIEQAHQAPLKEWVLKARENKIPILFLHGRNSRVWSIADYEAQRKELEGPLLQFESWEGSGHGLPFEQRLKFVEKIKAFAKQNTV